MWIRHHSAKRLTLEQKTASERSHYLAYAGVHDSFFVCYALLRLSHTNSCVLPLTLSTALCNRDLSKMAAHFLPSKTSWQSKVPLHRAKCSVHIILHQNAFQDGPSLSAFEDLAAQ